MEASLPEAGKSSRKFLEPRVVKPKDSSHVPVYPALPPSTPPTPEFPQPWLHRSRLRRGGLPRFPRGFNLENSAPLINFTSSWEPPHLPQTSSTSTKQRCVDDSCKLSSYTSVCKTFLQREREKQPGTVVQHGLSYTAWWAPVANG